MAVPTIERPPKGCDATWTAVWRALVAEMKAVGTWKPALWPFAVQYLHALRLAEEHRVLAEADPVYFDRESGLPHVHGAFQSSLAQAKRSSDLGDLLGITPKAQKALLAGVTVQKPKEPGVYAQYDEIAAARSRRTA